MGWIIMAIGMSIGTAAIFHPKASTAFLPDRCGTHVSIRASNEIVKDTMLRQNEAVLGQEIARDNGQQMAIESSLKQLSVGGTGKHSAK
jgi:hypothetical protein